jgi:hypothetical protein
MHAGISGSLARDHRSYSLHWFLRKRQAVPIEKARQRKYHITAVIPAIGTSDEMTFLLVRKDPLQGFAGCQNVWASPELLK